MATPKQFIVESSVEKLDPPTTVAGRRAEIANVSKVYSVEPLTGVKEFVSVQSIEIEWGVLIVDKLADLAQEKVDVQAAAEAKVAELDKRTADLSKLSAVAVDAEVKP